MNNEHFETKKRYITNRINDKVQKLTDDEKETVNNFLDFHAYEPSVAAERISSYLEVDYNAIRDLIY